MSTEPRGTHVGIVLNWLQDGFLHYGSDYRGPSINFPNSGSSNLGQLPRVRQPGLEVCLDSGALQAKDEDIETGHEREAPGAAPWRILRLVEGFLGVDQHKTGQLVLSDRQGVKTRIA